MSKNSSYGNGHVLRAFDVINATLDGVGKYSTPYVDVSEFQNFNVIIWNNNSSLTVTLRFSINGTNDIDKKVDFPVITSPDLNMHDIGTFGVKAKFLCVQLVGTPAQIASFQLVFRDAPVGTQNDLTNIGAGAQVLKEPNEIRTFKSTDGSVTITQDTSEINLVVPGTGGSITLSNAGSESLVNDGIGPALATKGLIAGTNTSFVSDTQNVTINSNSGDVVLSSAGGTEGLPVDTTGPSISVKGLSAGSGITLTPSASDITISSAGSSSPFQEVSAQITPITTTQTSLIGGEGNQIDTTTRRGIIWGQDNYTYPTGNIIDNVGIIASQSCGVTGFNAGHLENSGSIFSYDCKHVIPGGLGPTTETGFLCCSGCETYDSGGDTRSCRRSALIASLDSFIGAPSSTGDSLQDIIAGSLNCSIDSNGGSCCSGHLFCDSCEIGNTGFAGGAHIRLCCIASENCRIGMGPDNRPRDCCTISSSKNNCTVTGESSCTNISNCDNSTVFGIEQFPAITNSMINCTDSDITAIFGSNGQCTRNAMINTKSSSLRYDDNVLLNCSGFTGTHKGDLIAGDSLTGFTSESNDQCLFKFESGYKFYTNGALTTGMVAGAGANSFSAICERRFKENIEEVEYDDILKRLNNVKLYKYNYIGNNPSQKNISPMADGKDGWHENFKFLDGGSKDTKVIETMDAIGVCLSSVKALNSYFEYIVRENANDNLSILKTIKHLEYENENNTHTIVDYIKNVRYEMDKRIEEIDEKIDILNHKFENKEVNSTNIKLERRIHDLEKRLKFLENQH
jgi:hypothetical protein